VVVCAVTCDFRKDENKAAAIVHPNGKTFAGSETCRKCHASIYEQFRENAHYRSSAAATDSNVLGDFSDGKNVFFLNNFLRVEMVRSEKGMFQAGYMEDREFAREPIDVVIGSGQKGQTYLYWKDSSLFQLPISYFASLKAWCTSPGYPDDQILFNREISVRCLECHGTYTKTSKKDGRDIYGRSSMILRVDCERCHGPAGDHVKYQSENPDSTRGLFIINPGRLSRKQNLDNCALCHSGLRENIRPSFPFVAGDKLEDYSKPDYKLDSAAGLDVHGNQYGLLLSSKCFKNSAVMNCSTCHDPHKKETDLAAFSQKCMTCHKPGSSSFCKVEHKGSMNLLVNCIDCHMPKMLSNKIMMRVAGIQGPIHDTIRTHLIGIYLKESGVFSTDSNMR
jgi:hypothetical protein